MHKSPNTPTNPPTNHLGIPYAGDSTGLGRHDSGLFSPLAALRLQRATTRWRPEQFILMSKI